jgi:phosphate-selective porin OprO and OprP
MTRIRRSIAQNGIPALAKITLSVSSALLLTWASAQLPAHADAVDQLLEKLKAKGVLSDDEYRTIKEDREGEKAVARKRRQEQDEARTKADDAKKTAVVGSFKDGISFATEDGKNSTALKGRIQLDYRRFGGADALDADTFDIRRAFLTAQGKLYDYYEYDVTADLSTLAGPTASVCTAVTVSPTGVATCTTATVATTNASHLDVAWFNVAWWKQAQFRLGQFKMPMSLEELTSDLFLDFQERSLVNSFVPGKERGFMVHGVPTTGLYYGIALSTGQGKNTNDTNNTVDKNDVIGRVAVNAAEIIGAKNAVYHFGLSASEGKIPIAAAPSLRTEGRGITFFAPAAFTGRDLDRKRRGFETAVAYGPFKLQAEYLKADFSGTSSATTPVGFDRTIKTYYAAANWMITGETYAESYKNGVFGRMAPKSNFTPGGGGMGALELGVRYSHFDGADFRSTNPVGTGVIPATGANKAKAWTVGLKWLVNPTTRFMLNYVKTDFGNAITVTPGAPGVATVTSEEKALTLRGQFDF